MHPGCVAEQTLGSRVSHASLPKATRLFNARSDAVLRARLARFSTNHTTTQPLSSSEHEAHGHKLFEKLEWGCSPQITRSGGFHHQAALSTAMASGWLTLSHRLRHGDQHGHLVIRGETEASQGFRYNAQGRMPEGATLRDCRSWLMSPDSGV